MEIKLINKSEINIKNEPFLLFGRMIPSYSEGEWNYSIQMFPENQVAEMCFPEDDYNIEAIFVAAYENGICIGLAVLQDYWFKYMYLYDLKVAKSYRRSGVGKALIEKAKEIALEKGYRGIYTIGQDNNLAACKFYINEGFEIGGFDNRSYRGTSQEGKADIYFYLELY